MCSDGTKPTGARRNFDVNGTAATFMPDAESFVGRGSVAFGAVSNTRLGFGCGGLMRVTSRRERQRLLSCAFDTGIRHFDIARMYGLGAAEAELKRFAHGRRDQITIATKFGIEPAPWAARMAGLQRPARALLKRVPSMRAAVKRRGDALNAARAYGAEAARRSLERSLAEVGTDYFDIFLLHAPAAADEVMVDELLDFFREARIEGKIRSWGVASEHASGMDLATALGRGAVLQVRYDILASHSAKAWECGERILFGFLASALPRLSGHLDSDQYRRAEWASRLGLEYLTDERLAELLLLEALDSNRGALVLLSTTKSERVQRAADIVRTGADPSRLTTIRELAASVPARMVD